MKKLASVLMTLILALTVLCTGVMAESAANTWYLNTVKVGEIEMSALMLGTDMTLVLQEDGTGLMLNYVSEESVEEIPCQWTQDGSTVLVYTTDSDSLTFTLEADGSMVCTVDGSSMIFTTEMPGMSAYVPAPVRAGVALEEFNGRWVSVLAAIETMQMPLDAMGMMIVFEIENGVGTVYNTMFGETDEFPITCTVEETALTEGGEVATVLTAVTEATEDDFVLEFKLQMQEDGRLVLDDTGTIIYFENMPAEPAE